MKSFESPALIPLPVMNSKSYSPPSTPHFCLDDLPVDILMPGVASSRQSGVAPSVKVWGVVPPQEDAVAHEARWGVTHGAWAAHGEAYSVRRSPHPAPSSLVLLLPRTLDTLLQM